MEPPLRSLSILTVVSGIAGVGRTTIAETLCDVLGAADRRALFVDLCSADVQPPVSVQPAASPTTATGVPKADAAHPLDPRPHGCAVTVVDCPGGIHSTSLAVARASTRVVLVATPERDAVVSAYQFLKVVCARESTAEITLVVNRAADLRAAQRAAERIRDAAARFLGVHLVGSVVMPEDADLRRTRRVGVPPSVRYPNSPALVALRRHFCPDAAVGGSASSDAGMLARMASLFL